MNLILQLVLLVLGFLLLVKGADWFVDGAAGLAGKMGIPQIVIGLTIVAMGTSAPEAAISISSSLKSSADIAVGNVIGSNILNILMILGITAIITPLMMKKNTIRYEIPFLIIISSLFAWLGLKDGVISFFDGLLLWGCFLIYLAYLFIMAKRGEGELETAEIDPNSSVLKMVSLLIIGSLCIVFGSNITVDAATAIARIFGMSERLIGLTIVAFGTSLPELVTCVTAGLKKNADIAIGNIVGSNIFNILFVIGTSALITPVAYQATFLIDSLFMIGIVILLLLLCINKENSLKRSGGFILLAVYLAYFIYIL